MKILIFSQYYFPETGATSNRAYALAKVFQEEGHDVRVIAEKPNHPEGIFHPGFEKGMFKDGEWGGVPVTWCWVYTRPVKGFAGRMLFYLSYMVMAVLAVFRLKGKYDVVLATSPPLFVGLSGWAAARIKRARFVFDVRDLWPEVAVKMGELNNPKAIRMAEAVESFLYRKADLITPVTASFKDTIAGMGISREKMVVVSNGTEPEVFQSSIPANELRLKWSIPSGFIVSFIGNLGLAQGLGHIIEAARLLEEQGNDDIYFLFVGDGPRKAFVMDEARKAGVSRVIFRDRVTLPEAVEYMNASDALLVPLADDPIYAKFIPSKLFDSMAAGKPVLLSVDGEARTILNRAAAGLWYPAEQANGLVDSILSLRNHPNFDTFGIAGRRFVIEHYTRRAQAMKMLDAFQVR
jgi:glycosyltransferase involved in cell wall biosynthesis